MTRLACKICILETGLRGSEIDSLPETEEELFDHMERVHHVVVPREGESPEDADRRVLATIDCEDCRRSILARLA